MKRKKRKLYFLLPICAALRLLYNHACGFHARFKPFAIRFRVQVRHVVAFALIQGYVILILDPVERLSRKTA